MELRQPGSASSLEVAHPSPPIRSAERTAPPPSSLPVTTPSVGTPSPSPPVIDAGAAPAPSPRRLLVIGDSLSDTRVGGGRYLRAVTAACPSFSIDNHARGGFMVNQMRRRFDAELTPDALARYTDVLIFGGVNDLYSDQTANRTFEKITHDLSSMYRRAKSAGARVIALTVAPWGGFKRYYTARRGEATQRLNTWIQDQRATGLVDVVIETQPLLTCGDAERLCPEYESGARDGLHFGERGHERLGVALVEAAFNGCDRARERR